MTSPFRRRFIVIHNPTAGRSRVDRLTSICQKLEDGGASIVKIATTHPGHAAELAYELWQKDVSDRPDAVIAAGGDGTISEVAAGLAGSGLTLGVIPLGSANVLARELGLWRQGWNADEIAHALLNGPRREMSLGRLHSGHGLRLFVINFGTGFDAAVVAGLSLPVKRCIGRGAYVWSALKQWLGYAAEPIKVTTESEEFLADWVIVTNSRYYAGGYILDPEASPFNDSLTLFAVTALKRVSLLITLWHFARGSLDQRPNVKRLKGRQFTFSPARQGGVIPVQVDGDLAGSLPMRVSLLKEQLRVIYAVQSEK